jgi:hypothetical protein
LYKKIFMNIYWKKFFRDKNRPLDNRPVFVSQIMGRNMVLLCIIEVF